MNGLPQDDLGKLARDFYHGLLTRETYRQQRARLLEDLLSGETTNVSTRPRPADAERRTATAEPGDGRNLGRRADDVPVARSGFPARWIAGGAALVVVVLLGWFLVGDDGADAPQTADPAAPGEPLSPVARFLEDGNWSEANVLRLERELTALGEIDRRRLESEPQYARLLTEVRAQLAEQRALRDLDASAGTGAATARLAALLGLLDATDASVPMLEPDPVAIANDATLPDRGEVSDLVEATAQPVAAATPPPEAAPGARPATRSNPPARRPPPAGGARSVPVVRDATAAAAEPVSPVVTAEPAPPEPADVEPVAVPADDPAPEATVAVATPGPDTASTAATAPAVTKPRGPGGCPLSLLNSRRRYCDDPLTGEARGPRLAVIAAGDFTMGSDWAPEEGPPRSVRIARPFAMGIYEVSQADFAAFCAAVGRTCPGTRWDDPTAPVAGVSWDDAVAYTRWLSETTGQLYRLPSEAEWEFAARAGETDRYPGGDEPTTADARFDASEPVPRSYKTRRNAYGLYHTLGNVREWVQDTWHDSHAGAPSDGSARPGGGGQRVARGGCFADDVGALRLSSRVGVAAATGDSCTGFRVLRELN